MEELRKQALWNAGLPSLVKKCSRTFYKQVYNIPLNKYDYSVEVAEAYHNSVLPDDWKDAIKICESHFKKTQRIGNRIKSMFDVNKYHDGYCCLFLTLTFTDDVLASTSQKTRRTYVARFLKSLPNCIDYTANIDFGDKEKNPISKEREHYHANVLAYGNIDLKLWTYGRINCKKVFLENEKALAKYINKFKFHATKDSTTNQRIIYKRNAKRDYPKPTHKQEFENYIQLILDNRIKPTSFEPIF